MFITVVYFRSFYQIFHLFLLSSSYLPLHLLREMNRNIRKMCESYTCQFQTDYVRTQYMCKILRQPFVHPSCRLRETTDYYYGWKKFCRRIAIQIYKHILPSASSIVCFYNILPKTPACQKIVTKECNVKIANNK